MHIPTQLDDLRCRRGKGVRSKVQIPKLLGHPQARRSKQSLGPKPRQGFRAFAWSSFLETPFSYGLLTTNERRGKGKEKDKLRRGGFLLRTKSRGENRTLTAHRFPHVPTSCPPFPALWRPMLEDREL
ncbi:hypothetical protein CGRA01v4_11487 [Colletotrichum graminicola]|nr:hypothetical protein CGRA01v4_11487 [Colletotrichum graminicola]